MIAKDNTNLFERIKQRLEKTSHDSRQVLTLICANSFLIIHLILYTGFPGFFPFLKVDYFNLYAAAGYYQEGNFKVYRQLGDPIYYILDFWGWFFLIGGLLAWFLIIIALFRRNTNLSLFGFALGFTVSFVEWVLFILICLDRPASISWDLLLFDVYQTSGGGGYEILFRVDTLVYNAIGLIALFLGAILAKPKALFVEETSIRIEQIDQELVKRSPFFKLLLILGCTSICLILNIILPLIMIFIVTTLYWPYN